MTGNTPYRVGDFFLLRVPALPTGTITEILAAAPTSSDDREEAYPERVLQTWTSPAVSDAVRLAAPDLAAALDSADGLSPKDRRRAVRSLGRYLNRMSTRATPLGLMAGVAGGTFGEQHSTALGRQAIGRTLARADLGWVMHQVKASAGTPDVLVKRNDLLLCARGRVWLHTADVYGDRDTHAVSVHASAVVVAALDHARKPRSIADLQAHLADRTDDADPARLAAFVRRLLDLGMLVVAQRPPLMPAPGADRLRTVRSADNAAAALIHGFNATGDPASAVRLDTDVDTVARTVSPDHRGHVLQFDAHLATDGPVQLPLEVRTLVRDAATVMSRVAASEPYPESLRAYADAFTEHYGAHAEIPVLEVVSAEAGIGPPEGYLHPPRTSPLRTGAQRPTDATLTRLAARALAARSVEIELDDRVIDEFFTREPDDRDDRPLAPVMDVTVQLAPPDDENPSWRGVVRSTALGGRVAARFDDVLDDPTSAALRELAAVEEANLDGALAVELTYLPSDAHAANVAIRPALHEWELPVNVAPGVPSDRVLGLDDVRLGVRDGRFYLHSPRLGRELHVNQHTSLNPLRAPNVCRLLVEVCESRYRRINRFEWGELRDTVPFTPRLARNGITFARARWQLWTSDVDTSDADTFARAVRAWAGLWMVPRWTYLTHADLHILIDLHSAASLEELRTELTRRGDDPIALDEALPVPGTGMVTDSSGRRYESEVVVPLVRADCIEPGDDAPAATVDRRRSDGERFVRPGGPWVYVELFTEKDALDGLITTDVPSAADELHERHGADAPFFVRYSDPTSHLRVRFPVADHAARRDVLADVVGWAHGLAAQGRIRDFGIATYHREIERYGGPRLIAPAELVFTADSTAATRLVRHATGSALPRPALAALGIEALATLLVPDVEQRRALARASCATRSGGDEYREIAQPLWAAFTRAGPDADVLAEMTTLWTPPVEAFLRTLDEVERDGELWSDREGIVRSLLHLHCNRVGLDRAGEQTAYGIWRRLLDRLAKDPRSNARVDAV